MSEMVSVLFVCLGNICRSTMAEGVFRSIVEKPPYKEIIGKVDSCGTGRVSHSALGDQSLPRLAYHSNSLAIRSVPCW